MKASLQFAALALLLGVITACEKRTTVTPPARRTATQPEYAQGLDASKDLSNQLGMLMFRTLDEAQRDPDRFRELLATFVPPDPEAWCRSTFGDEGALIARGMKDRSVHLEAELASIFEKLIADGRTTFEVRRCVKGDEKNATEPQKKLISMMKTPCALYIVNFSRRPILKGAGKSDDDAGLDVGNWAYIDGGFRMVGDLR